MKQIFSRQLLSLAPMALLAVTAYGAAPGITGPTFNLIAQAASITQPDGAAIYSWGYGCNGAPSGFAPKGISSPSVVFCNAMQIPGPTLIVHEGDSVTVNLTNGLPAAAGPTSILFPGFRVSSSCTATTPVGQQGLLTCEAVRGGSVTYTFTATTPGTRAYYSGTQGDLQIEMGLYGAIIVLPQDTSSTVTACAGTYQQKQNSTAQSTWGELDFRLSMAAFENPNTCYDREYLFQFSEMDPSIHSAALAQVQAHPNCPTGLTSCLNVPTEPYHPAYFLINGRSMPDDMDPNYMPSYPHQPYNGNPHMHPGEQVLLRIIGQGRWQHPFHEHGNHVRILARDGNLITSASDGVSLAGPPLFTTTTTPGVAMDGIFYFTGRGLNWDMYAHNPKSQDPNATLPCTPDANGYNTGAPSAINYYEWCQDHNKPVEANPFGDVEAGGPVTLPNPNIFTNGAWYSGSPYLGPNATTRADGGTCTGQNKTTKCITTGVTPPSGTIANPPSSEAGWAFMWHSHNEREITTSNAFPGGMLMMMLVDSREFVIDESN